MSEVLKPAEVAELAESNGVSPLELSNAIFWLNISADSGEKRTDFLSGPDVIRRLLKHHANVISESMTHKTVNLRLPDRILHDTMYAQGWNDYREYAILAVQDALSEP